MNYILWLKILPTQDEFLDFNSQYVFNRMLEYELLKKDLDVQEYVQVCDEYGVHIDDAELQTVKVRK